MGTTESKEPWMNSMGQRQEHVKYLIAAGRFGAVRVACTCGVGGHAAQSWTDFQSAVRDETIRSHVKWWVNNPNVSRMCRDFAEQGTGIETLRGLLSL